MYGQKSELPHILFLFSDTGGGHRSAAEAIIESLKMEVGDQVTTEMVDIFKDYAPPPLNYAPEFYTKIVRVPKAWGLGYRLSDGFHRKRLITAGARPYIRGAIRSLISQHPSDIIVSVHPLATTPFLRILGAQRPQFVTVVTDLVTAHAFWYDRGTDLCIVPTPEAYHRALSFGLDSRKVVIVGLPVAERFCKPPGDRIILRQRLGWPQDRLLILLMGGGEGMGPLEQTAYTIASGCPSASLVIVTGRNQGLKIRLEAHPWPIPTFVYGFVRDMPDYMQAADILVTKAGPGTISEALNAGLPMILYSRLPGQEDGNVSYVVSKGAGYWAPRPTQIVEILQSLMNRPERLSQAERACRQLARPQASRQIASLISERAGIKIS